MQFISDNQNSDLKNNFISLSPQCLSSDLEHTSSDGSKTHHDDDNVPRTQVANKPSLIILENMNNETRKKINVFLFLVCLVTEKDDVNLKDKHT